MSQPASPAPQAGASADAVPDVECPHDDGARNIGVVVRANRFMPSAIAICSGDTVVWTNDDQVSHTVIAGDPKAPLDHFSSPLLGTGDTWSVTFDSPGDHTYYCSKHKPNMKGARIVVE